VPSVVRQTRARCAYAGMLLDLVIPDGVAAGESFDVDVGDGSLFSVLVPKGCSAGDCITVSVHAEEQEEQQLDGTEIQSVEVVIPEGVFPGHSFEVETASGHVFAVVAPDASYPGLNILVELEVPTSGGVPRQLSATVDDGPGVPRQRSQTVDDAHEGAGQQRPSQRPCSEWQHRYCSGQSVMVLRSDGSHSKGTIEDSFEGVFDVLYQVRLASGQCKPAVPEGDLFDAEDADDPNFGVHLEAAMAAAMEAEMLDMQIDAECSSEDGCSSWDYD
jgi:hypothetical protein